MVLEYLSWLVVVFFFFVFDLDPADAQANVRLDERDGLVDPPDDANNVLLVFADDFYVGLHFFGHAVVGRGHVRLVE